MKNKLPRQISDYMASQLSRVLNFELTPETIINRRLSCFGCVSDGLTVIDPCEFCRPIPDNPEQHYCSACGCGTRKILEFAIEKFPFLVCPLGRPGFNSHKISVEKKP